MQFISARINDKTHDCIEALGLATGTVSEHLQRIEAKLVAAYVDPP